MSRPVPDAPKDQLEFAWKVHAYTNEYIRFADSKAGLALAVVAGLVATLFGAKGHTHLHYSRLWFVCGAIDGEATALGGLSLVGFLGLLAAAWLLIRAIWPRLWAKSQADIEKEKAANPPVIPGGRGLIFWDKVREHSTAAEYEGAVKQADVAAQLHQVADHVHTLAGIAKQKYDRILWAVLPGVIGAIATVLVLYLMKG